MPESRNLCCADRRQVDCQAPHPLALAANSQEVGHSVAGRHHGAVLLRLCEVLDLPLQAVAEAQDAGHIAAPEWAKCGVSHCRRGGNTSKALLAQLLGQKCRVKQPGDTGGVHSMSSDRTGSSSWAQTTPSPGSCR